MENIEITFVFAHLKREIWLIRCAKNKLLSDL